MVSFHELKGDIDTRFFRDKENKQNEKNQKPENKMKTEKISTKVGLKFIKKNTS
jgi:hypothetical protein